MKLRVFASFGISMAALTAQIISLHAQSPPPSGERFDVVIYGGTSAAVTAAIQVARMGKQPVIIEPGQHVGGLTTGGLGATDIGNKGAIGGLAREFYRRLGKHYASDAAWVDERRDEYRSGRREPGEETMWTFEPKVAEQVMEQMLREHGIAIHFGERLQRPTGVRKRQARIEAIVMESGKIFQGDMFIDASYEGDLMATAGVSYHVGREANSVYGETLNGIQTAEAIYHQIDLPVDPYVEPGNPASGLLPGIEPQPPAADGSGDRRVQAYNFRMCLTDAPQNRQQWEKPDNYDPQQYELLARYFSAGFNKVPWSNILMPNRKTDINNNYGISTDFIGMNYDYPEADYATRSEIWQEHETYQKGLMWFLANDPRVPEHVRAEVSRWGLCRDEFLDTKGWPNQLYIREARRLVADLVMTQHHCQGREIAPHPVGLAAYTMDSHNTMRYVTKGRVVNEGDVEVGGFPPYPIGYDAIVPKQSECSNLLVPVCLSASHIAFGSIRMEPVFMVLGQSAGTAACLAIESNVPIQAINRDALHDKLASDGQRLTWNNAGSR